jgi:hypothetical protein
MRVAKGRIKAFGTEDAIRWYVITEGLPPGKATDEFLMNVYRRLGEKDVNVKSLLDDLLDQRAAFNANEQKPITPPIPPPIESPGLTKEKLVKQGGIKILNVDPGLVKLKPTGSGGLGTGRGPELSPGMGPQVGPGRFPGLGPQLGPSRIPQSVPRPTGGQQSTAPQLGSGVFAELADLFSLNLDAMWQTWKPSLAPEFDGYVKGNFLEPYLVKVFYLALRGQKDPRDVEDLDPEALEKMFGTQPKDVDLVQLVESHDQTVPRISRYVSERFGEVPSLDDVFQRWKSTALLYNAFAWSAAKHGGTGPTNVAPSPGEQKFIWLKQGSSSIKTRVYLTTAGPATPTVATELREGWSGQNGLPDSAYGALKYAGAGAAADRRDAIVIYVTDLDAVLTTIALYQNDNNRRNHFLNERVRLSRPADMGARVLQGVGIADHPSGEKSFSQLATAAVLKAREGARGSQPEFLRLLPLALVEVGLDPSDPSKLLRK